MISSPQSSRDNRAVTTQRATTDAPSIASLIPSGTDIVAALDLADRLVGVSHECDHPAADGLPVLTASTLHADMSPSAIDAAVSASVSAGGSLYTTDRAELHRVAPAVILSQDVCDVCAVNGEVAAADVPDGSDLVMLTAVRLGDLWDDLRRVGAATGRPDTADTLVEVTSGELDRVAGLVAETPTGRVVALDWGDPLFAAGHWVPDLIDLAGGTDVLATADPMSRRITEDQVRDASPDVVLFLPCGYGLADAVLEARQIPIADLCLNVGAELWALDATRLFSRCTPQAVTAGVRALVAVLHPDLVGPPDESDAVRIV